jgi:hypothetical protein
LLHQPGNTYWSILDADGVDSFSITLAGWENQKEVNELVFQTAGVSLKADSLQELASKTGISSPGLTETVRRYNELVTRGNDEDFHVFGPGTSFKPHTIARPPFYAVQFFPITRKTMGGVTVDTKCRVLSRKGVVIPGLFAVGEVTGFGGINGKAALEGTFLGPGILMGRIAGRETAAHLHRQKNVTLRPLPQTRAAGTFSNDVCLRCHDLPKLVTQNRAGFWHFEQSHKRVLARQYTCAGCHQDLYPFASGHHRLNSLSLTDSCVTCHGVQGQTASAE